MRLAEAFFGQGPALCIAMKKLAIVRGKFLNQYEMQLFYPLMEKYEITAFGSKTCYHDQFPFPVAKLFSPMDLSEFPYKTSLLNRIFSDAHVLFGLEEKLRGFDLVHTAETYFYYTKQCLEAKKRGYVKKVVATVLENIPFNNEGIRERKKLKARARQDLDHIIALTEKTKLALLHEGADEKKITVVPHGIDTKRFKVKADWYEKLGQHAKREFTILFVGRFEVYKGIYDVVYSVNELMGNKQLKDYRIKLLMVGDGSERHRLTKLINRLGLSEVVEMRSLNYYEMPKVYNEADIFMAPSKPTPTYEEQYCTVLLEAQASGLPIVTTRTGGIPENIGDAGLVVEPGSIPELRHAIKKYLLQPKLRALYAKRARERAETVHDIRVVSKRLARVYERVWEE